MKLKVDRNPNLVLRVEGFDRKLNKMFLGMDQKSRRWQGREDCVEDGKVEEEGKRVDVCIRLSDRKQLETPRTHKGEAMMAGSQRR
jgi:hypothetical protein